MAFSKKNKNTGETFHSKENMVSDYSKNPNDEIYKEKKLSKNARIIYDDDVKESRIVYTSKRDNDYYLSNDFYEVDSNPRNFRFEPAPLKVQSYKTFNNDAYQKNSDAILTNIKNQIFEETQKLLGIPIQTNDEIHNTENYKLNEAYSTGDKFEDTILKLAAEKDPSILEKLNNDAREMAHDARIYNAEYDVNLTPKQEAKLQGLGSYTNVNSIKSIEKDSDELEHAKQLINEYVEVSNQKENQQSLYHREDELRIQPEIKVENINTIPVKKLEQPTPAINVESNNKQQKLDEKSFNMINQPENNVKRVEDILLVPQVETKEIFKEKAPIINASERVQNIKNIKETEWEKVKDFVKEFNTSSYAEVVANVPGVLDANNAIRVDLDQKFYITKEKLENEHLEQEKQFKSMIDDYCETLKKQEQASLQNIYDEINKSQKVTFNNAEFINKQNEQNTINIKLIDENKKLKDEIKKLEEELNKPAPVAKIEPKMSNLELEETLITIKPEIANNSSDNSNNQNETTQQQKKIHDLDESIKINQEIIDSITLENNLLRKNENALESVEEIILNNNEITNEELDKINKLNQLKIDTILNQKNTNLQNKEEPSPKTNINIINSSSIIENNKNNNEDNNKNIDSLNNSEFIAEIKRDEINQTQHLIHNQLNDLNKLSNEQAKIKEQILGIDKQLINNNLIPSTNDVLNKDGFNRTIDINTKANINNNTNDEVFAIINRKNEILRPNNQNKQFNTLNQRTNSERTKVILNTLRNARSFAQTSSSNSYQKSFDFDNTGTRAINLNQIKNNAQNSGSPLNNGEKIMSISEAYQNKKKPY